MEMEEEGHAEMKDSKKFKGMNGRRRREEETFLKWDERDLLECNKCPF